MNTALMLISKGQPVASGNRLDRDMSALAFGPNPKRIHGECALD